MLVDIIVNCIPVEITSGCHSGVTLAVNHRTRGFIAIIYLRSAGAEKKHRAHILLIACTVKTCIMARYIIKHLLAAVAVAEIGIIFPIACGRGAPSAPLGAIEGEVDHRVETTLSEISCVAVIPTPGLACHPEVISPVFGIFIGAVALSPCGESLLAGILQLIPTVEFNMLRSVATEAVDTEIFHPCSKPVDHVIGRCSLAVNAPCLGCGETIVVPFATLFLCPFLFKERWDIYGLCFLRNNIGQS